MNRAGAVEQLRTHSRRINSLHPAEGQPDKKPVVELYEKGYGKDAAGIAMEGINYARSARLDVVLGMISHKKSLITIFGHKHKIKNFIKKFGIFHKKISTAFDFGLYLE